MNLPGYDAWKLACPYDMTAEQEQQAIDRDNEQQDDLREKIAAALSDYRSDIYLATIRRIVIEELNKLAPCAGEPAVDASTEFDHAEREVDGKWIAAPDFDEWAARMLDVHSDWALETACEDNDPGEDGRV